MTTSPKTSTFSIASIAARSRRSAHCRRAASRRPARTSTGSTASIRARASTFSLHSQSRIRSSATKRFSRFRCTMVRPTHSSISRVTASGLRSAPKLSSGSPRPRRTKRPACCATPSTTIRTKEFARKRSSASPSFRTIDRFRFSPSSCGRIAARTCARKRRSGSGRRTIRARSKQSRHFFSINGDVHFRPDGLILYQPL